MIPKIKRVTTEENFFLKVSFYDGKEVLYDLKDDITNIPGFSELVSNDGLFERVQLDSSRTCVFWNDNVDLPSDTIYEYGTEISKI